ncbi:type II secretion system F family protein [Vreelandella sp. EE7]
MGSVSLLLMVGSFMLLGAGLLLVNLSRRQAVGERVGQRLQSERTPMTRRERRPRGVARWISQAGLELPSWVVAVATALVLLLALMLTQISWMLPPIALVLIALVVYLVGQWRAQKRLERMIAQLPTLLDHMIRSIKSGRTLSDAMLLAMKRCPDPLNQAIQTVRRDIELGMPLAEAVNEFAEDYPREEFYMLALGVQVNQRYGGNSTDMLNNLIMIIRDREQASRQLSAMTGETRISAIVLAGLPIAIGSYILMTNPTFILDMWATTPGKAMLLLSLTLQVTGCTLLWRMLKSM